MFSTELDNKELEKQLVHTKKKIASLEESISQKKAERSPLVEQSNQIAANLDRAKERLAYMQSGKEFFTDSAIKSQQQTIKETQTEWDSLQKKVDGYDRQIQNATEKMNRQKDKAGELTAQIAEANAHTSMMAPAVAKAEKYMERFTKRIKGLARRVFIFTVITAALRSVKNWLLEVVQTNSEATDAIAKLKGALLTLAQPLVNVIIPAFTTFVNVLAKVVSAIANVMAMLFGTTVDKSAEAAKGLYEEQQAIKGVGSAAKKSTKFLAAFDEINQVPDNSDAGGGDSSASVIKPDFSLFNSDFINQKLDEITIYVSGSLLALGAILAFSGANIPLGIGLMVAGALGIASEAMANLDSMPEAIRQALTNTLLVVGGVLLAVGAVLVFSGVAIPTGLALMAAGALSLAAAAAVNWDSMSENLQEQLSVIMSVVSSFVLVIGMILALTGVNIPLGIAMIAMGAIGLAGAAALDWERLSTDLSGTLGKILSIVGSFLAVIGTILILTGVNIPLGLGLLVAGIACFGVGSCALQWDKMQQGISGALGTILKVAGGCLFVLGLILALTGVAMPLGIGLMIAGAAALGVSAVVLNWDAILECLKGAWGRIKSWWKINVSKYFTSTYWKQLGKNMLNGFISSIESGLNSALSGAGRFVNGVIGVLNKIPGVSVDRVSWGNIKLPRLATGAVIPPNREFMAVLGDQRNGNNLEAPESLIRKIVREESGGGNAQTLVLLQAILDAIRDGKVIMVDRRVLGKIVKQELSNSARASGTEIIPT